MKNTNSNTGIIAILLTAMFLSAAVVPVYGGGAGGGGAPPALSITIDPDPPIQGQTLTVTVFDGTTPVPGADVYFVLNGGTSVYGQTDANGEVNYKPLLTGTLDITAMYLGMSTSRDNIPVSAPTTPTPPPTTPTPPPAGHRGGGGGVPGDTDGDGISDIDEMLAGTDWKDPCDPNPECAACLALRPRAPAPTPLVTPTPAVTPTLPPAVTPTPTPAAAAAVVPPVIPWVWIIIAIVAAAIIVSVAFFARRKKKE